MGTDNENLSMPRKVIWNLFNIQEKVTQDIFCLFVFCQRKWQVTEKVNSGDLTNKQNGLTHITGSPQERHAMLSVIFTCFLFHPRHLVHSSRDHKMAAVASGTASSHINIQRQKIIISFLCVSF